MRTLLLTAFLLSGVHAFAQYTPETIPNNKLVNNSYVSNPDNILSLSTVAQLDASLGSLEQQTTAQVAVVVVRSIGDADIFEFAQQLFNLWGIGRANDNGLLILLVEDLHTVRFHTGYGLEAPLPDVVCKQIQRDKMVPAFKRGDYDGGMLGGVAEVVKILTDPNYSIEITATDDDIVVTDYTGFAIFALVFLSPIFFIAWAIKARRFRDSKKPLPTDYRQMRLKRSTWLIEFGGIPLLILIAFWFSPARDAAYYSALTLYLYYMATIFHRLWRERRMIKNFIENKKYFQITEYMRKSQWYWLFMAIIFPVPFLIYFPFHFARKKFYRNHPRNCRLCDKEMIKLSEIDDDQYLTANQKIEETIRSIDYDIWKCTGCSATDQYIFKNRFSKYVECGRCKTVATFLESDRTLVSATYSNSGKGEKIYRCKACGQTRRETYSIAQLTRSSDSSSGSSGSGSSSSSGGSWGGGSSGGGGASSSW